MTKQRLEVGSDEWIRLTVEEFKRWEKMSKKKEWVDHIREYWETI